MGFCDAVSVPNRSHPAIARGRIASGEADRRQPPGGKKLPAAGCAALLFLFLSLSGCGDCRFLSINCPQPPNPKLAAESPAPSAAYRIGSLDILLVSFIDHPAWDVLASVDVDGRLPLVRPGVIRVEGRTLEETRTELAALAGVAPDHVEVQLMAARSSHVYLHGPIRGRSRMVPYQGPERAIDFLKRVGGLPPGSKLNQVFVVRPNVAIGKPPEIFRVNVHRVLVENDPTTNVLLQPSDQVYIGETRESVVARELPEWIAPVYRRLMGLSQEDRQPRPRREQEMK